jgi:peptidoglycan/LPS O-acetylase OafA/YrhL
MTTKHLGLQALETEKEFHFAQLYRADIDGLRAVAIVFVVLFHAFPTQVPGGFIGVDIFFVISGYLITLIVLRRIRNGTFNLIDFYKSRAYRLLPTLIIVLTTCMIAGWFTMLPDELKSLGSHVFWSTIFSENFLLMKEHGYFDARSEAKPLLHLWSLAVEEQFYLVFPLLFLAARLTKHRLSLQVLTAIVLAASFIYAAYKYPLNPISAYYSLPSRGWEILSGSLLAGALSSPSAGKVYLAGRVFLGTHESSGLLRNCISLIGAVLVLTSILTASKTSQFPGWSATSGVAGSLFIIASGPVAWVNRTLLSNSVLVFIGLISYSLYLWHWPLLSFIRILWPEPSSLLISVTLLASVSLAVITFILIERPIKNCKRDLITTTVLFFLMIAVGVVGFFFHLKQGIPDRASLSGSEQFIKDLTWDHSTNDLCLRHFNYPERKGTWWFCATNSANPTVMIMGNSFANHLYPGLSINENLRHQSFISIGACEPVIGLLGYFPQLEISPCSFDRAIKERAFLDRLLAATPSLKYALISAWWPLFDASGNMLDRAGAIVSPIQVDGRPDLDSSTSLEKFLYALSARIEHLETQGLSVILFLGKPELGFDIRKCAPRPFRRHLDCGINLVRGDAMQAPLRTALANLKLKHSKLKVFDERQHFCKNEGCSVFVDARPLLRDDAHYSVFGSELMAKSFYEWSLTNIPEMHR